jgi:hypothetical protein
LALAGRALADNPPDQSLEVLGEDLETDDLLDEEAARSAIDAGAAFVEDSLAATSGLIDATSLHELETRHQRPSRWGRLDLAIAWRRIERVAEPTEPSRRQELWLVATWRH